ncbi:MAG: hypothetical protein QNK42_00450 [Pseudodonghicola sp.]|nr:hypothetical protein [Pseudodonghicola sp.]
MSIHNSSIGDSLASVRRGGTSTSSGPDGIVEFWGEIPPFAQKIAENRVHDRVEIFRAWQSNRLMACSLHLGMDQNRAHNIAHWQDEISVRDNADLWQIQTDREFPGAFFWAHSRQPHSWQPQHIPAQLVFFVAAVISAGCECIRAAPVSGLT